MVHWTGIARQPCRLNFRTERRSNETHASTTDPDARLYRKGPGMEARLAYMGHALMENRSGLLVDARLNRVSGHAERVGWAFTFAAAAYNLVRLPKLLGEPT